MRILRLVVSLAVAVAGSWTAAPAAAQATPRAPETQQATLTGVVRDTAGAPIADAEVVMRDQGRGARTDAQGRFTLANVNQGTYHIWFRRLGYTSIEYTWAARPGERTEVAVALVEIPRSLDPVIVRADEDRRAAAHASIFGTVVDSAGLPIPEAEVQLVGANVTGVTRAGGEFLFKPLGVGTYVVRVRKLGFAPGMRTLQLIENDDREVVIRLHRLPAQLDPMTINARSGYADNSAWDDFEKRKRWVSARSRVLGPEDLKAYYSLPLDLAETFMGMKAIRASKPGEMGDAADLACILIDGKDPVRQPLRVWAAKDIEALEIYPSGTEVTGTVAARFRENDCRPSEDPKHPAELIHPTYYVLWRKK